MKGGKVFPLAGAEVVGTPPSAGSPPPATPPLCRLARREDFPRRAGL